MAQTMIASLRLRLLKSVESGQHAEFSQSLNKLTAIATTIHNSQVSIKLQAIQEGLSCGDYPSRECIEEICRLMDHWSWKSGTTLAKKSTFGVRSIRNRVNQVISGRN